MRVLVTGGAGFIGSAVCRHFVRDLGWHVVNLDKLTYAGNLKSLSALDGAENYKFVQGDIGDRPLVGKLLREHNLDSVLNLAAESHVDHSINSPNEFVETNVVGTFNLLEAARDHWSSLSGPARKAFRFHHVSTDEVFGDLAPDEERFSEDSPYKPSSPYSASKAAADHFVRAWYRTYELPVVLSSCSNNYGPWQYPEKLIPVIILNALLGKNIPIYGNGENVRDWLFVTDHARALGAILKNGRIGQSYNLGGNSERSNLEVAQGICKTLDKSRPLDNGSRYEELIKFVADRPGHDRRYGMDYELAERELGWTPSVTFENGLRETVDWYLKNEDRWVP